MQNDKGLTLNHYKGNVLSRTGKGVIEFFSQNLGIFIGFIAICVAISILSPVFLTEDNLFNVLRQVSTNALLALGMTLVIILSGIDLSVGSIVALSGTLTVGFITNGHMSIGLAILLGMFFGTLCGFANGFIIANTGIPPFIVTLAIMNIARGAAYIYSKGLPIRSFDKTFSAIGTGYLGPIPLPVIYMVVFTLIISILLNRTKLGIYIFSIGGNMEAAKFSGIPIKRVQIAVYTITGFLCAFAGVVLSSRMYSGQPSVAQGFELDAIAACVLGGVSMSGGIGRVGGTVLGVLVIGVINNGLNLLNVNSFWQLVVKGIIILVAVYVDMIKKKKMLKK